MHSFSDIELINAIVSGDQQAFMTLVESYKNMVFRMCYGILQHKEDAEDISQEVFIQVLHSAPTFRNESKISTWLYRIAVNKSINFLNKKKKFSFLENIENTFIYNENQQLSTSENHTDEDVESIKHQILYAALEKIPPNQKAAFLLNHQEGLSYNEIAEVIGISHAAVESLIHRAKVNLYDKISKEYRRKKV